MNIEIRKRNCIEIGVFSMEVVALVQSCITKDVSLKKVSKMFSLYFSISTNFFTQVFSCALEFNSFKIKIKYLKI